MKGLPYVIKGVAYRAWIVSPQPPLLAHGEPNRTL